MRTFPDIHAAVKTKHQLADQGVSMALIRLIPSDNERIVISWVSWSIVAGPTDAFIRIVVEGDTMSETVWKFDLPAVGAKMITFRKGLYYKVGREIQVALVNTALNDLARLTVGYR